PRVQRRLGEEPYGRNLNPKVLRAPEPVRIPTPDVAFGGQPIVCLSLDRPVIDLHISVIAHLWRAVGKDRLRDVHLIAAEYGGVHKIGPPPGTGLAKMSKETVCLQKLGVRKVDVRRGANQPYRKSQGITQGAVGVRESEEQIRVPARGARHDVASPGQNLHGLDR